MAWRSRDQRRTEKDSKSKMSKIVFLVGLLSIFVGTQAESSLEKGGKTLTAEDSVHVVAEAHASGGDSQSSDNDDAQCEKCKAFVDFLRVSIEQGDTDVEKKAIEMCSTIASEDVCSEFKGKVKDVSESNFDELLTWLGSRELCVDIGMCEDQDASKKSSFRFKSKRAGWPWTKCEDLKCPSDGEPMVDNDSFLVGCVCNKYGCKQKSFAQFNLCRRACLHGDSPMCAQCFPSESVVRVLTRDNSEISKTMEELRVGDFVLTDAGFSEIFAFMDHNNKMKHDYISISLDSGDDLSISSDHIVWAHDSRVPVLAQSIKLGDTLWVNSNSSTLLEEAVVVDLQTRTLRGLHAPLTKVGSILVDGVLASSYAKSRSLTWGDFTIVSGHRLNEFMHAPLRWVCEIRSEFCGPNWHIEESGRHVWTRWILEKFGWLQIMNEERSDLKQASMEGDFASVVIQLSASAFLCVSYYALFAYNPVLYGTGVLALIVVRHLTRKV